MNEVNGTGIEYPSVVLGGVTYTVKFMRGAILYRMSRLGVTFADLQAGPKRFSALFDVLYSAIQDQYTGTPEQLVEMTLAENKLAEIGAAVGMAIAKVFPPAQPTLPETAGNQKGTLQ